MSRGLQKSYLILYLQTNGEKRGFSEISWVSHKYSGKHIKGSICEWDDKIVNNKQQVFAKKI